MNHPEATTSTAGRGGRRRPQPLPEGAGAYGGAVAAVRAAAGSRAEPPHIASPRPLRALPGGCAMHPVFQSSRRDFTFGPWRLSAARTHIMKSAQAER